MKKSEQSLTHLLWDTIKSTNICIMEVPGEEREKRAERISKEIMIENFLNFIKGINLYIQQAQGTPNRINSNNPYQYTI